MMADSLLSCHTMTCVSHNWTTDAELREKTADIVIDSVRSASAIHSALQLPRAHGETSSKLSSL